MLFLTLSGITWERKAKSGNKYALINSYCFVQFFWVPTTLKPLPTHTHDYYTLVKPLWTLQYSNSILTSENFRLHHVVPGIGISQHELKPNSTVLFCFTYQVFRSSSVPGFSTCQISRVRCLFERPGIPQLSSIHSLPCCRNTDWPWTRKFAHVHIRGCETRAITPVLKWWRDIGSIWKVSGRHISLIVAQHRMKHRNYLLIDFHLALGEAWKCLLNETRIK